ncbi:hypothetical protein GOV07_00935 [Candidatus Woesearchaeota archaeon]|nr:hypothetical protein [Candidatus Woesearchaeota archaeon]
MPVLIDDADIDEWFQMEKERLSDRLTAELDKGADFAKVRAKFDKDYQKLFVEYEKKFIIAEKTIARRERVQRPVKRFRAWREGKKKACALWWKLKKEHFKKWRFEREYRRLFHIKKKKL